MNREKEESESSLFPNISTVGEAVSAEVHGGIMNGPSEFAELGHRATIDPTECIGTKREARQTRRDTWRGREDAYRGGPRRRRGRCPRHT